MTDSLYTQSNLKKRILIVDDDPSIREVLGELMDSHNYDVETASDGFEALSKLVLDIDLILLDVEMPGLDGFEVAKQIRQDKYAGDVPIIFITGMASQHDRLRAVEAGGNDFIAKPFDSVEISIRVASLLKIKKANDDLKRYKGELETIVERRTADLRRALDNVVESQRRIRSTQLETIQCLVAAAEFKDLDTANHIKRMSLFSALLAKKLNLPPGEVELVQFASPMHDIGKIGTPEDILLKKGKLTEEEFGIIKQHTQYGSRILTHSQSELIQTGQTIALTHHEKWDGSGYPHNLVGDEIPLFGRICAISDVFDALTSVRSYKDAFTNDNAVMILEEGKGSHFDPELVDIFVNSMDEVKEIQLANTSE